MASEINRMHRHIFAMRFGGRKRSNTGFGAAVRSVYSSGRAFSRAGPRQGAVPEILTR
jgi:hypothetical protein